LLRWGVNKRWKNAGLIDYLTINNGPNLAMKFGLNEYTIYTNTKESGNSYLHFIQKKANIVIEKEKNRVVVTGVVRNSVNKIGALRFKNTYEYEQIDNELKVTIEREYTDEVTVFDDSVCFICNPGWYIIFRLYSPNNTYYDGYFVPRHTPDGRTSYSEEPRALFFNPMKPLKEQNLFAKAEVGGWGEIIGPKCGLRFTILDFIAGESPVHRIVQPRSRSYVEFEFQFDVLGIRYKGQKQKVTILITPISYSLINCEMMSGRKTSCLKFN